MARYNNDWGAGTIGRGLFGEIENNRLLCETPIFYKFMWTMMLLIHLLMSFSSIECTS